MKDYRSSMSPASATARARILIRSGLACAALGFVVVVLVTVLPRGPVASTQCVRPERSSNLIQECVAMNAVARDSLVMSSVTFLGGLSLAGGALLLIQARRVTRRPAEADPAWDAFSPSDELSLGPFESTT